MNLKQALQYRLLGVPAWLWGVVIGGGIAAYAWITRSDNTLTPAPAAPPSADYSGAADAGDIQGVPTVTDTSVPVTTNPAWVRVVTDRLVALGYDPVQVNNALTKGLAGLALTAQEAALWNEAVRRYGAPPEGAPPITVTNPGPSPTPTPDPEPDEEPSPSPVPTPPPGHWEVVVKYTTRNPPWNSTISGMAAHFGISPWTVVWNHPNNASLRGLRGRPELIRPGDRVWIPGK